MSVSHIDSIQQQQGVQGELRSRIEIDSLSR
jgi:hypothetical protein